MRHQRGFANCFVTVAVGGPADDAPIGNNPLYVESRMVGKATSVNYGFRLEQSLAFDVADVYDLAAYHQRVHTRCWRQSPD